MESGYVMLCLMFGSLTFSRQCLSASSNLCRSVNLGIRGDFWMRRDMMNYDDLLYLYIYIHNFRGVSQWFHHDFNFQLWRKSWKRSTRDLSGYTITSEPSESDLVQGTCSRNSATGGQKNQSTVCIKMSTSYQPRNKHNISRLTESRDSTHYFSSLIQCKAGTLPEVPRFRDLEWII